MPDINDIPPMSDEGLGNIPPIDGLTPIDAFNLGVSIGKRNAALEERPDEFELCHNCRVLTAKYGRGELHLCAPCLLNHLENEGVIYPVLRLPEPDPGDELNPLGL